MNAVIFIRSYNKDFEWLSFALRSIHKFASGFKEIVIAVPIGHEHGLRHLTAERLITVHDDGSNGYCNQQESKLNADLHMAPDVTHILHIDSDTILIRPVTPDTFMREGKPIWMITPWEAMKGGDEKKAWFHVMCKCLQECPPYEFMRKVTPMVPRWAYAAFREHIQKLHGISMTQYVMSQPNREFTEWNCLGFFLWLYHRDSFFWWDTTVLGVPEKWEDQRWSWGGLTQEIKNEFNIALA